MYLCLLIYKLKTHFFLLQQGKILNDVLYIQKTISHKQFQIVSKLNKCLIFFPYTLILTASRNSKIAIAYLNRIDKIVICPGRGRLVSP
mgnify:FL=1